MTQNILVGKFYSITDHTQWYDDRTNEKDLISNYEQMSDIMTASARKHLVDLDEVEIHRGEATHIRQVFQKHFYKLYDLWKQGGVNILYCDLDVVFLREAQVFDQFDHFAMFNYTDPPRTRDEHYGLQFDHYFNCGVRYYPADMNESVWEYGLDLVENWNPRRWDAEQIIYNAMMWGQGIVPEQVYRPRLSWQMLKPQPLNDLNTRFNGGIRVNDAEIVHVHGSRGSESRRATMANLVAGSFGEETLML